jgi:hypothetical protein
VNIINDEPTDPVEIRPYKKRKNNSADLQSVLLNKKTNTKITIK